MPDDVDAEAIRKRRSKLIALALAGVATAATACGPEACLSPADGGSVEADAGPADADVFGDAGD